MSREVPTPGSTTATCTVPAGKYPNARASQKPASAGQWTMISWVRSMIRAAGMRERMRPFITPTKGPWCPKSVVMVMTPEATGHAQPFLGGADPGARRAPSAQVRQRSVYGTACNLSSSMGSPQAAQVVYRPSARRRRAACSRLNSCCADSEMAPRTSSDSRWVTCSAKSALRGSDSCLKSALALLARVCSSSRRLSRRARTACVSTAASRQNARAMLLRNINRS